MSDSTSTKVCTDPSIGSGQARAFAVCLANRYIREPYAGGGEAQSSVNSAGAVYSIMGWFSS